MAWLPIDTPYSMARYGSKYKYPIRTCVQCKRKFSLTGYEKEWNYQLCRGKLFCSYSCDRAYHREHDRVPYLMRDRRPHRTAKETCQATRIPIVMIDRQLNILQAFSSCKAAERETMLDAQTVYRMAMGLSRYEKSKWRTVPDVDCEVSFRVYDEESGQVHWLESDGISTDITGYQPISGGGSA